MQAISSTLDDLYERGMSRHMIAKMLGVAESDIPMWRKTPKKLLNQVHVQALIDFLDALAQLGIQDPVAWLEVEAKGLPRGYRVQLYRYYEPHTAGLLLDVAAGRRTIESLLDALEPDWRQTLYSAFDVVEGPDGGRAIVLRDPA